MERGEPCILGNSRVPDKGDDTNTIRADLIRFFACGGDQNIQTRGGIIELQGAWVPEKLDLSRADIQYAMAFPLCHFDSNVRMEQAKCPALYFDGAHLEKGFEGEGMQIKGDLRFCQKTPRGGGPLPFTTHDEIQLASAEIGGYLDCHCGFFWPKQPEQLEQYKTAFFANKIRVGGCFNLIESHVCGRVNINGATIGSLEFRSTNFNESEINIVRAEITDSIVLLGLSGGRMFNLDFSKTKRVVRDESSCDKFKFSLKGFVYRDFVAYGKSADSGNIQFLISDWLSYHSAGDNFSPQPFGQAAKVLFDMGYNKDARDILLEKERLLTEKGQLSRWHRRLRRCWDFLAGYGYEWWRTLAAAAVVIGFGWAVFFAANCFEHIVPHQPVVMVKLEKEAAKGNKCAEYRPTKAAVCLLPQYPRFNSLAYSADVFIPFFALHQEQYWYPQPPDEGSYGFRFVWAVWLWFEVIAGWVLTSLFLLTITGLLRPRQSSGVE